MTAALPPPVPASPDATAELNAQFAQALRALREAGQQDLACRLAARAWAALHHSHPGEARRLERLLHLLVHPVSSRKPVSSKKQGVAP